MKFEEKRENELGRGEFGIVYKGTFEGNAVAVKITVKVHLDDERKKEQKREMEEQIRLDHENVLKLLHVDESRDKTYEMELNSFSLDSFIDFSILFAQMPCARVMCRDTDRLLREEIQRTGIATRWRSLVSNRQWIALRPLPKFGSSQCQTGQHPHLIDDTRPNEIGRFRRCQENKSSGDIYAEWIERNSDLDGARNFGAYGRHYH